MELYKKRMIIEKEDLQGKIKKAKKAIELPPYGMDKHALVLLAKQIEYMEGYLRILKERIDYKNN